MVAPLGAAARAAEMVWYPGLAQLVLAPTGMELDTHSVTVVVLTDGGADLAASGWAGLRRAPAPKGETWRPTAGAAAAGSPRAATAPVPTVVAAASSKAIPRERPMIYAPSPRAAPSGEAQDRPGGQGCQQVDAPRGTGRPIAGACLGGVSSGLGAAAVDDNVAPRTSLTVM